MPIMGGLIRAIREIKTAFETWKRARVGEGVHVHSELFLRMFLHVSVGFSIRLEFLVLAFRGEIEI